MDRFDQETLDDIKAVYRVGVLFLLYPMYWALYDQQGSRWTIQVCLAWKYTFHNNYICTGHEDEWIHLWLANSPGSNAGPVFQF